MNSTVLSVYPNEKFLLSKLFSGVSMEITVVNLRKMWNLMFKKCLEAPVYQDQVGVRVKE